MLTLMSYSSTFSRDTSIRTTETKFLFCLCSRLCGWPPPTTMCLCSRLCGGRPYCRVPVLTLVFGVPTAVCLSLCLSGGRPQYRVSVLTLVWWTSLLPCACAHACVVDVLTTVCLSSRLCCGRPLYRVPVLILVLHVGLLTTFFLCYKCPYYRYAYACSK